MLAQSLLTFLLVTIGWVFFRSDNMQIAMHLLETMFSVADGQAPEQLEPFFGLIMLTGATWTAAPNALAYHSHFRPSALGITCSAAALGAEVALIAGAQASPFLYFQF